MPLTSVDSPQHSMALEKNRQHSELLSGSVAAREMAGKCGKWENPTATTFAHHYNLHA